MATAVHSKKVWNEEARAGILFALLPILQFFMFTAGPFLFSIFASFTDWNSMGDHYFIGLENYVELFQDERFWKSLWNTFYYMIGIPIGMVWAFSLALAFNRDMPGVKVFRVIYYIPVVSSIVAVSILWRWLYNGDYGLLNQFLWWAFKIKGPNWMYNTETVKAGITAMMVWKGVGIVSSLVRNLIFKKSLEVLKYYATFINNSRCFARTISLI